MIRVIKLKDLVYENIEAKYIDENGNEIWNIPSTVSELQKAYSDTLIYLSKQRLNQILEKFSYNGLADVQFYASQNDEEALQLLDWYQAYDDAIWNWIDNEVSNITDLNNLLNLDMKAIEQQIFDQAIQIKPLP